MSIDEQPGLGVLLAAGWRAFTDLLHTELDAHGYQGARPAFGPVFKALRDEELTTTQLADRLGVTKQAVAKVVSDMREQGLVDAGTAAEDARAKPLALTARGRETMTRGAVLAGEVEERLLTTIGAERLQSLKESLTALAELAGAADDIANGRTKAPW